MKTIPSCNVVIRCSARQEKTREIQILYVNTHIPIAFCCGQGGGYAQHAGHLVPSDNVKCAAAYRGHPLTTFLLRQKRSTERPYTLVLLSRVTYHGTPTKGRPSWNDYLRRRRAASLAGSSLRLLTTTLRRPIA